MPDAPTPPTPEPPATPPDQPTPPEGDDTDWKAEARKWEERAKKDAERAKANANAAKELERLQQQSMTEQERAVATAKAEARAEALREVGKDRVDDAVRVAAAGRDIDVDALLDGLDRSRFLDDDGRPDTQAIAAWVDKVAPAREEPTPGFPDLGQGARTPPMALNGDPLERALRDKLGIR